MRFSCLFLGKEMVGVIFLKYALSNLQIRMWQLDIFEVIRVQCQPLLNAIKTTRQEHYTLISFSHFVSVWHINF